MSHRANDELLETAYENADILYVVSSFVDGVMVHSEKVDDASKAEDAVLRAESAVIKIIEGKAWEQN